MSSRLRPERSAAAWMRSSMEAIFWSNTLFAPKRVLLQKIASIDDRIHSAALRSGRKRADIRLIAVTKKFPATILREAYAAGLRDFGENYVQEFEDKYPELTDMPEARYHLIGHLQSNKSKKAAELFQTIQTVDSAKLARRLDAEGQPLTILI